ncbi:hypothetical protein, partial [Pantoea sp. Ae16]|uniref:hypothetical protein n=1 Tax=Pantoea sp. Ae16 TaxID=1890373 RepID=UPI001C317370
MIASTTRREDDRQQDDDDPRRGCRPRHPPHDDAERERERVARQLDTGPVELVAEAHRDVEDDDRRDHAADADEQHHRL